MNGEGKNNMLLCLNCYKVYNQKTIKNNMCKVKNCHGDIVEIDELFTPVIIELNRKGYKTKFCCSGHYTESSPDSYIYFEDDVELPSLPEGYRYDQDIYVDVDWDKWNMTERKTIRRIFDKDKSIGELSKDIFMNAVSVLEWAEGLEEVNKGMEEMEELYIDL